MGRSRGGLTTKIHAVVDASGLPLRFALSPGQAHDSTLAGPLLDDRLPPDAFVLADKAYDAEWIRAMIEAQDAVPIIPDRSSATTPHAFSRVLYRMRNRVERFFNKLKQFSAHRNALRKARRQLPRHDQNRHNPHLVAS